MWTVVLLILQLWRRSDWSKLTSGTSSAFGISTCLLHSFEGLRLESEGILIPGGPGLVGCSLSFSAPGTTWLRFSWTPSGPGGAGNPYTYLAPNGLRHPGRTLALSGKCGLPEPCCLFNHVGQPCASILFATTFFRDACLVIQQLSLKLQIWA